MERMDFQVEEVIYYARFPWDGERSKPKGIVRRRVVDGIKYDEAFTRNLDWEPTEYFELYRLGHDDDRYEEITKEEADTFIEQVTHRLTDKSE